ncbi:hypothetical protein BpHYR1_037163 [Brachionus plicatilis]|uniref:Uncharacterized protein n=1 Tax=Brachionus plicatilis TaxID=10195 RepID=A0A3M7REI1_BRAPC|nr:hypothetical protein BpHYR1_037163 [Brachionus plicatilis]
MKRFNAMNVRNTTIKKEQVVRRCRLRPKFRSIPNENYPFLRRVYLKISFTYGPICQFQMKITAENCRKSNFKINPKLTIRIF